MRNKSLIIGLLVLPLFGGFVVAVLNATATFTYRHPQGDILTVTRDGRVIKPPTVDAESNAVQETTATAGGLNGLQPRAVASDTSHDFGTMDPLTMGRHTFSIRNDGDAPLSLVQGPTTCKCTLSKVAQNEIAPGSKGEVTLDWNTGRDRLYSHEATVFTNDPTQEVLHFRVHGKVRRELGTVPEKLTFAELRPDQPTSAEVLVYSQVWEEFELVNGQSSNDAITWSTEPVDKKDLKDALAAHRVRLTIPSGMPSGPLSERIQFIVRPAGADETTLDLAFQGKVPRRLAVIGPSVDIHGVVDLGQVYRGESRKTRLLLKVRDEDMELITTRIKCEPDFISANVLPYEGSSQRAGLSTLEIELPESAPTCSFLGVPMGLLRIDFDHPRIHDLELKLKFAVVEKP